MTAAETCLKTFVQSVATEPDATCLIYREVEITRAQLWRHGLDISWASLQQDEGRFTSLPCYAFAGKRHWIDAPLRLVGPVKSVPASVNNADAQEIEDVIKSQIETMQAQLTLLARGGS